MCYDNGYPSISREFQFRWLNIGIKVKINKPE